MVQFSSRTNLSPVWKWWYNTQTKPKPVTGQKKMVIQSQNLSPLRKKMVYTQTKQPVTSQKKMVQYSNRAKTCQLSDKVRTKLERSQNLIIVRKRWYNTPTGSKTVISKKNLKTPQYSNRTKWIHHVKREVAMSPTIYSPILQSYPAAAQKWMLVKKCPMLNCK